MPDGQATARPRWVQLSIVLTAVGLAIMAAATSFGSLQKWQSVPAAQLGAQPRSGVRAEPASALAPAPSSAAAAAASPFGCVAPLPAERTLEAMAARYRHPATGLFFVTFTNKGRMDFALTWAYRLCRLGLSNFAVGALDRESLEAGSAAGVPMFQMGAHELGNADYGWNTPRFKLMGQDKVQLLLDLLRLNVTAVLMDADAVLVNDPNPFFLARPEADLLVPTDFTALGAMDGGLEAIATADHVMNIGILYATPAVLPFAAAWREFLRANPSRWDQTVFNDLLKANTTQRTRELDGGGLAAKRLWRTRARAYAPITVGVLPIASFCSGHTWSVSKLPQRARLQPLVYHTAFVFAGGHGKRHRMREHRIWYDPPAYYAPDRDRGEVGFLSLDTREPPDELLRAPAGGGDGSGQDGLTVDWHFRLVHWQLARVRSGMLLAQALSRRFVMPRLVCGFDRWWASHKGIIPNSATLLPIRECPMDHVFNLMALPDEWMPKEYSFLENDRLPAATLASRRAVPYPNYAAASAVLAELSEPHLERAAVLQVDNIGDVYSAMRKSDDARLEALAREFAGLAQRWMGEWCCTFVPKRVPGDIAYDFFADLTEGHTDKYGRQRSGEWHPRLGSTLIDLRDCAFSGPRNFTVTCDEAKSKARIGAN